MLNFRTLWLLTLAVKLVIAVWLPLSNDEAYYWVWSHHLQLSYYDHPPMVSWLFWLGEWIDIGGHGLRIPAVILGHSTLLIWHQLLRPYLDDKSVVYWLAFIVLSPFMGAGSLIVTPDLPLLFFWSLALYVFHQTLLRPSLWNYAFLGAALGLGFCAKYHMVLFVPIAWAYLAFSGRWRAIKYQYLPVAVIAGLAFCTPVWLWNMQNEWISFLFQLKHGLEGRVWKPSFPLEYLLAQFALLFPPLVFLMIRRREPRELRWLEAFALAPLLFFFYTSFKAHVEANWPVIAHPVAHTLAFLNAKESPWIRWTMYVWALVLALVLSQVAFEWLPNSRNLKTAEFSNAKIVAEATAGYEPLYTSTYQLAAALSYQKGKMIYKVPGMSRVDFYDFRPEARPSAETFYIANVWEHGLPQWLVDQGYQMREIKDIIPPIKLFEVTRHAKNTDR